MNKMFLRADCFDVDLSRWNVQNVEEPRMFATGSPIEGTMKTPIFEGEDG